MNIIKIYLNKNASGSVAELYKDFALFVNSYQNKLIDVYVPKSMLYSNEEITFINAVKIGALLTAQNGETITSDSYYLNYLKDETINNVEYSVYERILPKEFTVYPGNVTITTNVLSMDNTDVLNPVMLQVVTTQTSNLLVQNSAYIGDETPVEPTKTAIIEGQLAQDRYEILDLKDRMTDAETQIDLNTENIATNTEDIAKIKLSVNISETYIGQMTGSSLPTTTQLNNYVELAVDRTPNNGDVIIFILTKTNETDKNYKYIYSLATGWNYYELPPMEPAYNGSLGLVKGSYNVGVTRNVLIDLNAGEFTNIYVKNVTTNNYLTLDTFINNLYNEQQGIKNGTIAVGLATKAVNDGNGDNIVQTYMTNNAGATKEYVQNYALPKEFFQMYFIDSNGYVNEPPTEPSNGVQFTKQVNSVGEFNIFNISRINASSIKLTNKNSAETSIYISANQDTTFQLKLTTYAQKQGESAQNLSIELSNEITITSGDIYKVDFQSNFNELIGILDLSNGDILGQSLSVITQSSQSTTYTIISNDVYPSSQIMNTQSLVVIGQQGNLGEIPVYELTGTITGTNIDFDFGNKQIYGNTLARFILRVSQQTGLELTNTLNLIYNGQNVRIATPYNYLTGNATIENLQQTNITFDAVNGTIIDFIGFINIDSGDNITVFVNEDNFSDFQSKLIVNLQSLPDPTPNSPDLINLMNIDGTDALYRKQGYFEPFNGTNLSNTTWRLNKNHSKLTVKNINFTCKEYPGVVYNQLWGGVQKEEWDAYSYGYRLYWTDESGNTGYIEMYESLTITIYSGSDTTNSSFIQWLQGNATVVPTLQYTYGELQDKLTAENGVKIENNIVSLTKTNIIGNVQSLPTADVTSPDFIQRNGIVYYKKLGTIVTDLTNSTWLLNSKLNLGETDKSFEIVFNSNSAMGYSSIIISATNNRLCYSVASNVVYENDTWIDENYRTIEITGGTDITNSNLIKWLQENAILLSGGTTTTGYSYKEIGTGSNNGSGGNLSGGSGNFIPTEEYIDLTNDISNGSSYTAPDNGWIYFQGGNNRDAQIAQYLQNNTTGFSSYFVSRVNYATISNYLPVNKGDIITFTIEGIERDTKIRFYPVNASSSSNLNIYSLEEVVIGTYLDKPLYRKLVPVPGAYNINQGSEQNVSVNQSDLPTNVDRYIHGECITYDYGSSLITGTFGGILVKSVNYNNSTIGLYNAAIGSYIAIGANTTYVALDYTKTTDL